MKIDRDAFLAVVGMHPHQADIIRFSGLSRKGLVQAVYVGLFHRIPDEKALQVWKDQENLEDLKFRKTIMETVRKSEEGRKKQVSLIRNIYSDGAVEEVRTMLSTGYGKLDRLYAIYAKMPQWMKRLAKKIMR